MNTSIESHAHENGVVPTSDPAAKERRARLSRAMYAGASAGLRTFTLPAAAMRANDNAWAPLFGSFARAEIIYDKLPETPSRLSARGLGFRIIAAGATAASLATRKNPAWLPYAAVAVGTALASAWVGATLRIQAAERELPDFLIAAVEDQLAIHWANRAFPMPEPVRDAAPAVKTLSLL